eukprot:scaffold2143_cov238-Ochromonas_danica.AAC.2
MTTTSTRNVMYGADAVSGEGSMRFELAEEKALLLIYAQSTNRITVEWNKEFNHPLPRQMIDDLQSREFYNLSQANLQHRHSLQVNV